MIAPAEYKGLVQSYISLMSRYTLSSTLRERNANWETATQKRTRQNLIPYFPFVLLIGPNQLGYTGLNNNQETLQTVGGPVIKFNHTIDHPSITLAGSSGNLEDIVTFLDSPEAFEIFLRYMPSNFDQILDGNQFDDYNRVGFLEQFYRVMSEITGQFNIKIKTFLMLKAWVEEPNVVVSNLETFPNIKQITIADSLYPLGKTYQGLIESFSYTETIDKFRQVDWNLSFKIITEVKNDFHVPLGSTKNSQTPRPNRTVGIPIKFSGKVNRLPVVLPPPQVIPPPVLTITFINMDLA